jgi:KaiC/GvpD/RAD55 family RecA-like ATPase
MGFDRKSHLANSVIIPIFKELIPDGIEYGTMLLVEFEPDSIWYDVSLTIAVQALRNGIKTDYHTFQRPPSDVGRGVAKFGLDAQKLQEDGRFRIIDSYTVQTKLGEPERPRKGEPLFQTQSVSLSDWSIATAQTIKTRGLHLGLEPELEKRRFHIDDDTSVLLQYNAEKVFIDYWRTRTLPGARALDLVFMNSTVLGVHSEAFYNQLESLSDGIFEFKREETGGARNHLVRVKAMRGQKYDTDWHRITVGDNLELTLD